MKNKILQEFLNSNIKIKSQEKLNEYIDYCIDNNQGNKIINEDGYSKTSHHHILPKSIFEKYSNLKECHWNGTHLLYSDHYYAHWLLTEAIDNYGQLCAFCAMHNKDAKLGRIDEKDLIPKDEFQKKMEQRRNKCSEWRKTNPEKDRERVNKQRETITKEIILEDGSKSTIAIEAGKKASIKFNEEIILEDGTLTTIALQRTLKSEITRDKEIMLEDGTITTRRKQISNKKRENNRKIKDLFKMINGKGEVIKSRLLRSEIKEISPGLLKTSKEKPLGQDKRARSKMRNLGREFLIGAYIEKHS